ncbi:AraC family transcriptional regulator [Marinobacter sp. CHS3-4]|uniref:helix-turn-helix domain-containing protein n=1 Tax=Marinobacter sp. CHS3-4 TaxID=3045174 RepID=UPI0024B5A0DA|nr:AraC family transcriptional regulator [Marinobacter sp. CHS3-4]MDI9243898.1 AraC family transcriptional regulator [Marinobacter sp. CHS3-4]
MEDGLSNLLYLWPRRTLFVGHVAGPIDFSQAAASLLVGIRAPLQVQVPGQPERMSARSLMLAPGKKLRIETSGGLVAACYLDALGQDYRLLSKRMKPLIDGVHGDLPNQQELFDLLCELHQKPASPEQAYERLELCLNPECLPYSGADPRVEQVIELIHRQIGDNVSIDALAESVNLSVSRLVELFREQVGVPVRRYRQWHRLFVTFTGVNRGESLTDAAIAAGFTDSAHFSHTFRVTLGMKPSDILAMLSGRLFVGKEVPPQQVAG